MLLFNILYQMECVMITKINRIPPVRMVSMDKPSLFMDKSFLESLRNDELQLLNQYYAVIHTVTLWQEIQRNTIEDRGEKRPGYISLTNKWNESEFPKQDHYLTMMKMELLGHTVILNRAHGIPYLVPYDKGIQDLNWAEGNLSEADKEKARELKRGSRIRAIDVGTERFIGMNKNLAHSLKNDLECLTKKNVTLTDFISEITEKLKYHLSSPNNDLSELPWAFEDTEKFRRSGKQVPGTVPTFEILEQELDHIVRNWNYIKANIQTRFPYTYHYLVVNAFLNIGIPHQKLRDQMSLKEDDNLSDLQYLYYLPFCNVFVSSDRFHRAVVPAFLKDQQKFIWGFDLKKNISAHAPSTHQHFIIWPNPPPGLFSLYIHGELL